MRFHDAQAAAESFHQRVCRLKGFGVPWNPEEEVECKRQGDSKVMVWWAVVDGKMLAVQWMVDENGRPESVNSERYQDMLKDRIWPEVRYRSSWHKCLFMQDGATSHTTNAIIANTNFLAEKFRGRVISCRSERFWPTYIPNLNVLDFCIWGYIQSSQKSSNNWWTHLKTFQKPPPKKCFMTQQQMCICALTLVWGLPVVILIIIFNELKNDNK